MSSSDTEYVYAIVRPDNQPVMATRSREHAFEECRKLASPLVVGFDGWINGEVCRVTHKGVAVFFIYCLEVKS